MWAVCAAQLRVGRERHLNIPLRERGAERDRAVGADSEHGPAVVPFDTPVHPLDRRHGLGVVRRPHQEEVHVYLF